MTTLSFDAGAAAYARFMGWWSRLWIPALLAAARVAPGQRVLDVATGTGAAAVMAASIVGAPGRILVYPRILSADRFQNAIRPSVFTTHTPSAV